MIYQPTVKYKQHPMRDDERFLSRLQTFFLLFFHVFIQV